MRYVEQSKKWVKMMKQGASEVPTLLHTVPTNGSYCQPSPGAVGTGRGR